MEPAIGPQVPRDASVRDRFVQRAAPMKSETSEPHPGGASASLWMDVPLRDFPRLSESTEIDVCVVGAGIAGLTTAYPLAKAGRSVVVLDDGEIASGESCRTTAHLSNAMDDRIFVLESVHGEEGARLAVESHGAAINRIGEIVRLEGIDCDFQRLDGWLVAASADDRRTLERELEAAHRAGLADVTLLDRAPVAAWNMGPALRFPGQATFHPVKYLAGLADAIVRAGGRIHGGTHVSSIRGGERCTVETSEKQKVRCGAVVVCTNASIADMVVTHAKMAPYRTYAIAARVPRGAVTPALYWDTVDPYHYVRLQPLDAAPTPTKGDTLYDALIVGGEDHRTGHHGAVADAELRWRRLEQWMRERWPEAGEVIRRWSGQVLEPNDYLAFIGPNPDGAKNVYMCSGDSGQGMTHGTIAGMMLTDAIVGRESPWAKLYDPKRVSLRARPLEEFAVHNAEVAFAFAKDYLKPSFGLEGEIRPGEGRVIRRGIDRVAAYRDASGTLHERSAVCTHLKCVVHWNAAETSWDCPCHGSRFDPYGKVLNGPAAEDLGEAPE